MPLKLDQQVTAYHLACYGMGIAFVTDTLIRHVPDDSRIVFYKLPPDISQRNIYFYHKRSRYVTRAMEEFFKNRRFRYPHGAMTKTGSLLIFPAVILPAVLSGLILHPGYFSQHIIRIAYRAQIPEYIAAARCEVIYGSSRRLPHYLLGRSGHSGLSLGIPAAV
ncbi:MAG: LysR substrate-binding domain-containing protein [Blautia sp.]